MSIESELSRCLLRFSNVKWHFSSEFAMQHFIKHRRPKKERAPHHFLAPHFDICLETSAGFPVYQVQPKNSQAQGRNAKKHILFLHGGAYVSPIKGLHWDFLKRLMTAEPCSVTVPLYGLAPNYNFRDAYRLLDEVYQNLLSRYAPEDIVIMGDSSGGGLALGFAQVLRDAGLPQPGGVVLLSPWLDIRLQNPAIAEVEPRDPILAVAGNQEAGRLWAAGADPAIPQLSPITGSLAGLAPICALVGTDDILMPDVRLLRDIAKVQGCPMRYCEYDAMFHIWMLSPIPEARRAMQEILRFLRDSPQQPSGIRATG